MEPITHFLTGACLGRSGFNRTTGLATLTLTLAAEAPDLDVIAAFWGPLAGFAHHRGFSHTFIGAPVMSALVTALVWIAYRIWSRNGSKTRVPVRWSFVYLLALLGSLSHILLDFTNNYGVRPFAPFNPRWYSWDILFIIEPVLLIVLALGLLLPGIFGLVQREIGGKRPQFRGRGAAILALVLMLCFCIWRDAEHRQALAMLNARTYSSGNMLRAGAMPYPVDPTHWYGIVETENAYETFDIQTATLQLKPSGGNGRWYKSPDTAATLAAKKSDLGRIYLDWARFPVTETVANDNADGWMVYLRDLRFTYSPIASRDNQQARNTLSARVQLDRTLHVIHEWIGNQQQN